MKLIYAMTGIYNPLLYLSMSLRYHKPYRVILRHYLR